MKRLSLLALGFLASCATVTDDDVNKRISRIEERLNAIEERQKSLEMQTIRTETRLDNTVETLTKLRLDVEKLRTPDRETKQAPALSSLPETTQIRQMLQDVRIDQKPDFQKEYEEILRLYDLRQLNQAREGFISYIRKYPNTPLTDNAYLWLGVTYRDLGELNRAEAVWLTLVEKCKRRELVDCNKAPSALLQLARLYEQRGDQLKANEYYEAILRDYPLSEEVDAARRKLGR